MSKMFVRLGDKSKIFNLFFIYSKFVKKILRSEVFAAGTLKTVLWNVIVLFST